MHRLRGLSRTYLHISGAVLCAPIVSTGYYNAPSQCQCTNDRPPYNLHAPLDVSAGEIHASNMRDFNAAYETVSLLGKGGFAEVWRVRHRTSGEYRAAKFVCIDSTAALLRFHNEIEVLAQLDSPFVPRLVEYYTTKNVGNPASPSTGIIVYRLIEGVDLLDYMNAAICQIRRIPVDYVRDIVREMLQCLEYIHSEGIVHRDVKPENFIVSETPDGRIGVGLIDFGLADDGRRSNTGAFDQFKVGPSIYMSPEIFTSTASTKSDVWSVGVVLLTILAEGTSTIQSTSLDDIILRNVLKDIQNDIRSLSEKAVPASAISLLTKLLSIDPRERLSAAAALQEPFFTAIN